MGKTNGKTIRPGLAEGDRDLIRRDKILNHYREVKKYVDDNNQVEITMVEYSYGDLGFLLYGVIWHSFNEEKYEVSRSMENKRASLRVFRELVGEFL